MTCRHVSSPLRSLLIGSVAACLLWMSAPLAPVPARAQDKPLASIDDDCTAMAFAPDGRLAYAVRHEIKTRQYVLERDDIWILTVEGKRRRLINGEKLGGLAPFSYTVSGFRWSPSGHLLAAELSTTSVIDQEGRTRDSIMTLLFDQDGKEIRVGTRDGIVEDASDAAWLSDDVTVVYLTEAVKPNLLFSIQSIRPVAGRGSSLFSGRTFVGAAWDTKRNLGYAVERDRSFEGPPRLQRLDLTRDTADELATLDSFAGGLSLSPSGAKIAYYLDHEVLEIRDLAAPSHLARTRIGFGAYAWSSDERRILIKRATERKTGDLVWFDVPPLAAPPSASSGAPPAVSEQVPVPFLHDLTFRDFDISPNGRTIAVMRPGKQDILIYPLN
ncbi:MAG: hypothetical protein ABSF92_00905 [Candidatus Acidiferrales bacterium]